MSPALQRIQLKLQVNRRSLGLPGDYTDSASSDIDPFHIKTRTVADWALSIIRTLFGGGLPPPSMVEVSHG